MEDEQAESGPDAARGLEVAAPADASVLQLTVRAAATGMVLGAVLSLCNIYTGLKIGWGTNMSITSVLLAYGFWLIPEKLFKTPRFGILENNINQAAASAGGAISSAGLVAPIPALAILTGRSLPWHWLALWVFSMACVGIVVAVAMRRQMLLVDKLPFPYGIATGETLKEMYARGREALARVFALVGAAVVAAGVKTTQELAQLKVWGIPGSFAVSAPALAKQKVGALTLKNLGFAFEPSLLFLAIGALIGVRAGASLLVGVLVGWGVLAPIALIQGWAAPGKPNEIWFGPVVNWLLWPGVALMVTSSLTSFAMSWRTVVAAIRGARGANVGGGAAEHDVSRKWLLRALAAVLLLATLCQVFLFGIPVWIAVIAVLLTFVLAIVAGRVTGETGITPVGPMGKVTQFAFGVMSPGDPTANLMAANVTGGAASQCGDLLHDLRTGLMLGAWPRLQAISQMLGVLAGALAGSAAYLLLIPDPKGMLIVRPEWPAPAVVQWKAVAEVFQKGFSALPTAAVPAMAIAAGLGIVLAIVERRAPARIRRFLPSPSSMGLALVVPAYYSVAMFLGAMIALGASRLWQSWSARFLVVVASGIVAGESLAGVVFAVKKIIAG